MRKASRTARSFNQKKTSTLFNFFSVFFKNFLHAISLILVMLSPENAAGFGLNLTPDPPVLQAYISPNYGEEGQYIDATVVLRCLYSSDRNYRCSDYDFISMRITGLPFGVNAGSDSIYGTPAFGTAGTYRVTVNSRFVLNTYYSYERLDIRNTFQLIITTGNYPPTIDAYPSDATVGVPYSFQPQAYDRNFDIFEFLLDYGTPNNWDSFSFDSRTGRIFGIPRAAGRNDFSITVVDFGGKKDTARFSVRVNPPPNSSPVAKAGGPYQVVTGQPLTLNGTASTDPDGDVLSYQWNLGALATTAISGVSPTISITAIPGSYPITLTVSDGKLTHSSTTTVTVLRPNNPPVADAGGSYQGESGQNIFLDASFSSDPDSDPLSYEWDLGSLAPMATGIRPVVHINAPSGRYPITLTVSDGRTTHTDRTTVEVKNYDVAINLGGRYCGALANGSNPVNSATGNKFQLESDYQGAGPFPLVFQRYYNSDDITGSGCFGTRWRGSYDRKLVLDNNQTPAVAKIYQPDGNIIAFSQIAANTWSARAGIVEQLQQDASGWRLINADDTVEHYDSNGRLFEISNRQGLKQTLSYVNGQLDTVSDDFGRTLRFTYNADGTMHQLIDPANELITYDYDVAANLATVTYPGMYLSTREYLYEDINFPHALTGIIDANGNRFATWKYDTQGRAIQSLHGTGADQVDIIYHANGSSTVTDAKLQSRTYTYQNQQGVLKVAAITGPECTVCGGVGADTSYDANGFPDIVTDFNGVQTDFDYNARGLIERRVDAVGTPEQRVFDTIWHNQFRLPVCQVMPDRTISYTYNNLGQITKQMVFDTSNAGIFPTAVSKLCTMISGSNNLAVLSARTVTYSYNADHLLATIDGPLTNPNDITLFNYDINKNLSTVTDAKGNVTTYSAYDAHGRPGKIVDPNNSVTLIYYDSRGRLLVVTVDGEMTFYGYDQAGNLKTHILPDDSTLTYDYDNAHRLIAINDEYSNSIRYQLDALGNREKTEVYDANNVLKRTQTAVYDQKNHLSKVIGAVGQTTQYTQYDANGNLTEILDPALNVTQFGYDALNRRITVDDSLLGQSSYQYDALDNLTQVTDPRGINTLYSYDGLGNLLNTDSPDTGITEYDYDKAGYLNMQLDARGKGDLRTYRDALGRPTSIRSTDGTYERSFYDTYWRGINIKGRLHRRTNSSIEMRWNYDPQGRIIEQRTTAITPAHPLMRVQYQYAPGTVLLSHLTTAAGTAIDYQYFQGKLTGIQVNGQQLVSQINYEPFGTPSSWRIVNGGATQRHYNLDGQISQYTLGDSNRTLSYYATGEVKTITDSQNPAQIENYVYDKLGRLTDYTAPGQHESYSYDQNGNRTHHTVGAVQQTLTVETLSNKLSSKTGTAAKTYQYDAAGNRTGDGQNIFTINDKGIIQNSSQNGSVAAVEYLYDFNDQRIAKIGNQPARSADYNADGIQDSLDRQPFIDNILKLNSLTGLDCNADTFTDIRDVICINQKIASSPANKPTSGNIWYSYDQAGHLLSELDQDGNAIREYIWLDDIPVAVLYNNTVYTIYTDHLNTPRLITDAANQPVWRWESDPFGEAKPDEDPDGDGMLFVFNLRFPGQYYDAETGLHYNWNRYYDPATGGYITSDPIGLAGGLNTYGYVGGNPLSYIDPLGLDVTGVVGQRLVRSTGQRRPQGLPTDGPLSPIGAALTALGLVPELAGVSRAGIAARACAAPKSAAGRAKQIHSALDPRAQRMRTTAVTETQEGVRVISSSNRRLSPAQRAQLGRNEVEGIGAGHAEVTGVNAARNMGLNPTGTAASRPICPNCARSLADEGVNPLSPLK